MNIVIIIILIIIIIVFLSTGTQKLRSVGQPSCSLSLQKRDFCYEAAAYVSTLPAAYVLLLVELAVSWADCYVADC